MTSFKKCEFLIICTRGESWDGALKKLIYLNKKQKCLDEIPAFSFRF